MKVAKVDRSDVDWEAVRRLLVRSFAYMEPMLGHAPSVMRISAAQLAAERGELFLAEEEGHILGCVFGRPSRDNMSAYYIGRLAVDEASRGLGLARNLVEAAKLEARGQGFGSLTLDTSADLHDLHRTFAALGFGRPFQRLGETGVVTMEMPI